MAKNEDLKYTEDELKRINDAVNADVKKAYDWAAPGITAANNTANVIANKSYNDLLQQEKAQSGAAGVNPSDTIAAQNEMAGRAREGALTLANSRFLQQAGDAAVTAQGNLQKMRSDTLASNRAARQSMLAQQENTARDSLYNLFINRRITAKQFKKMTGIPVHKYR